MSSPSRKIGLQTYLNGLLLVIGVASSAGHAEVSVEGRFTEEIVVTAEKRETSLQSIPLAVTALGREELAVRGIEGIADLQFAVPGLVFNTVVDTAQVTIRGVGVDFTTIDSEPGVALYSDGSYRGGLVSQSGLMFDLERIEVVRGPQGTLNGRNSTGGSVNVISRLPGSEPGFEMALLYGDYDRNRIELSGDLPMSDALVVRGAVVSDNREGYADNNFTGREADDAKYSIGKFSAVYTPKDTVELILRAEVTDSERGGPNFLRTVDQVVPPLGLTISNPGGLLNFPGNFCGASSCADALDLDLSPGGVGSLDPRELYSDEVLEYELESSGFSATVNWQINDQLQLRSISSYFELGNDFRNDVDGTEIPAVTNDTKSDIEEYSQEFTLIGTTGALDWITGVYYYSSEIDELYSFELPAFQATFEAVFGFFSGGGPLPPGSLALFGNRIDGTSTEVPFIDNQMLQDAESIAAYTQGTYNFSDTLRGSIGLRYTRDEKDVAVTFLGNLGATSCTRQKLDEDWSEVTGKVGIDVDLSENTMVYGLVSRGYKSGGFNAGDCNDPYDPEILIAYEVGSKMRMFNGRMRINSAAFYYDYTDIQARLFVNNAASVENASEAASYGAELEVNWLVTENLRIDGSISLLNTEYQDHGTTNPLFPQRGYDCNPMGLACLEDISGNSLLRSPELKASLIAEYNLDLGKSGTLTLRGEYAYTDEVYHTIFNDDIASEGGFSVTNARIIWTPVAAAMEGVSIVAFVENLTDEEYATTHIANATTGGVQSVFAPPRTWGVQLRYSR